MNIMNLNDEAYVLPSFLEDYEVKKETIIDGIDNFKTGKSLNFEFLRDQDFPNKLWIKYSSIPSKILKSYLLPLETDILEEIRIERLRSLERRLYESYSRAVNINFTSFQKYYNGIYYDIDYIVMYAKAHALFAAMLAHYKVGVEIKELYRVYDKYNYHVLGIDNVKTFYRRFKEFRESNGDVLTHSSLGRKREPYKVKKEILNEVIRLYCNPNNTIRYIHQKVLNFCSVKGYEKISLPTIKAIVSKPEFMNMYKTRRYGKEWSINNFEPYHLRSAPEFNGLVWQIDGSRFQIPYLNNKTGREAFLNFFVVMDIHSRKIVGHSTSETENKSMIINALHDAVNNTKRLPFEILRDNGSSFRSREIQRLEDDLRYFGTYIRSHIPGMPRDKGHVERFFGTFQTTVLKQVEGYVGEGIRSRREGARSQKEILNKVNTRKKLRSKYELIELIDSCIKKYNEQRIYHDEPSPNEKYNYAKWDKKSINLNEDEVAKLFWNRTTIKVKNSFILLSEGGRNQKKFQYIIHDLSIAKRINLTNVTVLYRKEDRSSIILLDNNDVKIIELKLSPMFKNTPKSKDINSARSRKNQCAIKKLRETSPNGTMRSVFRKKGSFKTIKNNKDGK